MLLGLEVSWARLGLTAEAVRYLYLAALMASPEMDRWLRTCPAPMEESVEYQAGFLLMLEMASLENSFLRQTTSDLD